MDWTRYVLAVVAAGIATTLTDWLFMGVLFHDKYRATPEVWRRPEGGKGESRAVAWSAVLGVASSAAFIYLCARLNLHAYHTALKLAVAVWVVAPLPLILTNSLWLKYHPLLALSHSAGWLARLVVSALAMGWLKP